MAPPEPEPPETDVRRCPTCQGERITNVGPVFAYGEIINRDMSMTLAPRKQ